MSPTSTLTPAELLDHGPAPEIVFRGWVVAMGEAEKPHDAGFQSRISHLHANLLMKWWVSRT